MTKTILNTYFNSCNTSPKFSIQLASLKIGRCQTSMRCWYCFGGFAVGIVLCKRILDFKLNIV